MSKKSTKLTARLLPLPLSALRFDPENPRIVEKLGSKTSQKQIQELLLNQMEARELVPSFMANGYLPYEPLIVRRAKGDQYEVIEGNRRLAALNAMSESEDADEAKAFKEKGLGSPPCVIFEGDERQELAYLGLRHLSKTKDWDADAKAAFVERILRLGVPLPEAAREVNTTTSALRNLLLVRRLFERAGALGLDVTRSGAEGDVTFWHLGDAIRRSNTKSYLKLVEQPNPLEQPELDENRFERLVGWLYGNTKSKATKIIGSIRDIPELDRALGHSKSVEFLEAGGSIAEALEEREAAGARATAHLGRAKVSVQKATGALSDLTQEGKAEVGESRAALEKALGAFDRSFDSLPN